MMLQNYGATLNLNPGSNRSKNLNQLGVDNDLDAIACWLREYAHKPTTLRSYKKEAERLLMWCAVERKKSFSSLDRQDFAAYGLFLSNPIPKEFWCGPKARRIKGTSSTWRPFVGPLNERAKQTTLAILNSLMNYLVQAAYLESNPLSLIRRSISAQPRVLSSGPALNERMLDDEEWEVFLRTLELLPEQSRAEQDEKERLRFLVAILFLLGLRVDELASHTWSSFRFVNGYWWFYVKGKGDKEGKVPVNDELQKAMIRFRKHLRLSDVPNIDDNLPLIPSWMSKKGLGARQINNLLKGLALETIKQFSGDSIREAKFRRFSAHWLRHLSASMQDRVGISFKHIKENHRHAHDQTTRKYVHAFDRERHDDMQKLRLTRNDSLAPRSGERGS